MTRMPPHSPVALYSVCQGLDWNYECPSPQCLVGKGNEWMASGEMTAQLVQPLKGHLGHPHLYPLPLEGDINFIWHLWKRPAEVLKLLGWENTLSFSPLPAHHDQHQAWLLATLLQWSILSTVRTLPSGQDSALRGMSSVLASLKSAFWFSSKSGHLPLSFKSAFRYDSCQDADIWLLSDCAMKIV